MSAELPEEGDGPAGRFGPCWSWMVVIGEVGGGDRGVVPESEHAPEDLHEWKPESGRDELEHQVV